MMTELALTVVVCSNTVLTASAVEDVGVQTCQVFTELRPISDLRSCLFATTREELGRQALARADYRLKPGQTVETTCRRITGGSGNAAG